MGLRYRRQLRARDRLMCAMVAPPDRRGALLALLAFNLEIAGIPELVSEPSLGEIRQQWWRDTVTSIYAGSGVNHPVALGLADGINKHRLAKALFDEYFDARAFDLGGHAPESLVELEAYADGMAGALSELMGEVLGLATVAPGTQPLVRTALRHAGAAWALSGILEAIAFHTRQGRSYLPADLPEDEKPVAVAAAARHHIAQARAVRQGVPKLMLPVLLFAFLAEERLRRLEKTGFDPSRGQHKRPGVGRLFRFYGKVLSRSY